VDIEMAKKKQMIEYEEDTAKGEDLELWDNRLIRSWNVVNEGSNTPMDEDTRRFVVSELDKLDGTFTSTFGVQSHFMTTSASWVTAWPLYVEGLKGHAKLAAQRTDVPKQMLNIVEDLAGKMLFVTMETNKNTLFPRMPLMTKTVATRMVDALKEIPWAIEEVSTPIAT
jgi:hypothetical protein